MTAISTPEPVAHKWPDDWRPAFIAFRDGGQPQHSRSGFVAGWTARGELDASAIATLNDRVAELEEALRESLAVIDDYLSYKHDGDPWSEDARLMGEMDINDYGRDGRRDRARAALEQKP